MKNFKLLIILILSTGYATAQPAPDPNHMVPAEPNQLSVQLAADKKPAMAEPNVRVIPALLPLPSLPAEAIAGKLLMNFQNASLSMVLEYLSRSVGLIIVDGSQIEGRITLYNRQPMELEDAITALNTALKEQGYAAIRMDKILKIVPLSEAKQRNIPVFSGSDPSAVKSDDLMITQVIPLSYADAGQLKRDLATLIPTYGDLQSNASTNSLVYTATRADVRRLMEIVRALDDRMNNAAVVRVFQLKYANAATTSRLITELFRPPQSSGQNNRGGGGNNFRDMAMQFMRSGGFGGRGGGGGMGGMGGPGTPGNPGGDANGAGKVQQAVVASSDDRTNTVVISASPDQMKLIEQIVTELDNNPIEEQAVFIYPLKNAQASNLEGILNNLFGATGTGSRTSVGQQNYNPFGGGMGGFGSMGGNSGFGGGMGGRSGGRSGSSGFGGSGNSMFGSGGGFGGINTRSQSSGRSFNNAGNRSGNRTGATGGLTAPTDLVGQVFVVADLDTNSLLVTTSTKNFDRVKLIIADLDRAIPHVLIKVLLAEVTHSDDLDLGAEFSILNLRASGNGQSIGTDFNVGPTLNNPATQSGLAFKLLETNVTAAIRALATTAKLDVLSRPYILTGDNQPAAIMVGQTIPFITSSRITGETGQTINTIDYNDIGIILQVVPHVNPDGLVIMDVYPEISALTGETVPISDTASYPVIAKRSAQSRVAIRDGQTIVIGGLMEDRLAKTVNKTPLLGDIPIIGNLFKRTISKKAKTELLIFLTPHVAPAPETLTAMTKDELDGVKIVPQAVGPGVFQEHLQGLQRGELPPESRAQTKTQPRLNSEVTQPGPAARENTPTQDNVENSSNNAPDSGVENDGL